MPKDRNRSIAACLTVTDFLVLLPFFVTVSVPYLLIEAARPTCHCEPTGPREARPDARLREAIRNPSAEALWIASSLRSSQ
jgi:hypothetical protein